MTSKPICHVYVGNIPKNYRSADLRVSFSQFVESHGFKVFHYKHRPEYALPQCLTAVNQPQPGGKPHSTHQNSSEEVNTSRNPSGTFCCITQVYENRLEDLISTYTDSMFCDRTGIYSRQRICFKVFNTDNESQGANESQALLHEFKSMPELHPPPVMPYGNVGTPLSVFYELIQACILPSKLIKDLNLKFPKSLSSRRYGNVPLKYEMSNTEDKDVAYHSSCFKQQTPHKADVTLKENEPNENTKTNISNKERDAFVLQPLLGGKHTPKTSIEDNLIDKNKGDPCSKTNNATEEEDWERHEALHDDVDAQARTKERLFEEDIELKWEKGGSGLVFYTDAYYWHEKKGKDFDEETADDWDIDMSVYTEADGGDMDARDLLKIRIEDRRNKGLPDGPTDIAEFEKHTKAFGSQQLHKHGWTKGTGLGSSNIGIIDPIEGKGQSTRDKRGIGYLGTKLERHPLEKKRRAERDVIISTIFDEDKDPEDNVMQRTSCNVLKYVDTPVNFVKSNNIK